MSTTTAPRPRPTPVGGPRPRPPLPQEPEGGKAKKERKDPSERRRLPLWAYLTTSLVLLFLLIIAAFSYLSPESPGQEITVDELAGLVAARRVVSATFRDQDAQIVGDFASRGEPAAVEDDPPQPALAGVPAAAPRGEGRYHLDYVNSDATTGVLIQAVTEAGAQVRVDPQTGKGVVRVLLSTLLPLMVLANLFALLFAIQRSSGQLSEIRSFGTLTKRGGARVEPPAVRFTDVAGADEAVAELREVVQYLQQPARYAAVGASPPKGVLLAGPPGTGKTLIARATAGEAGVPFFSVAGAEFVESLVGIGAARVRDLFARVRAVAPAIVFIDELDAAGRRRGAEGGGGGSDEREQTLNQLLVEMDGFDASSGIVVMGATNRPDILDPALLRPGRFDRHVTIDQPDIIGRERILQIHAKGKPIDPAVDLTQVARRTPGFTGADLANVVNEAALLAIRENKAVIGISEFNEAVQRVLSGPQRRGRVLSEEERRRIAYHEAGHAIVTVAGGHREDVQRISVVARGRTLGSVQLGSDRDAVLLTRSQLSTQLAAAMSGRASEELVFGDPSTGSEGDLELATRLARDFAAKYGMSPNLGRVRLMSSTTELFLGSGNGIDRLSGLLHQELDREVRRLLDEAFATATDVLVANAELLDELAERVLAEETLEGPSLDAALVRVILPDPPDATAPLPAVRTRIQDAR